MDESKLLSYFSSVNGKVLLQTLSVSNNYVLAQELDITTFLSFLKSPSMIVYYFITWEDGTSLFHIVDRYNVMCAVSHNLIG